jgi:hypothetical protein
MDEIEGFTAFTVTRDGQLCSGHRTEACVWPGTVAYEDADGFVWCESAARDLMATAD